jgi:hypothetical protein
VGPDILFIACLRRDGSILGILPGRPLIWIKLMRAAYSVEAVSLDEEESHQQRKSDKDVAKELNSGIGCAGRNEEAKKANQDRDN